MTRLLPLILLGCSKPALPDVFLVTVDTLRADHTSPYGYARDTTPWLSRLASRGTTFEHCVSTSSWTVPSLVALHTGLHPWTLGMHRAPSLRVDGTGRTEHPVLPEKVTTLAERFREAGYKTAGLTTNAHLSADLGWAQGFDTYDNLGWATVDSLDKHLDSLPVGGPRFVWLHVFDPHDPYLHVPGSPWPPPAHYGRIDLPLRVLGDRGLAVRDGLIDLYDGEILDTDRWLSHAVDRLGVTDQDIILVASDHGEEFGERGHLGHRKTLHEESVHVPCILAGPDLGGRETRPIGLPELGNTLLAAAGIVEHVSPEPVITHLWHPGSEAWAAYGSSGKQILVDGQSTRFNLAADPGETVGLPPDDSLRAMIDTARLAAREGTKRVQEVEGLRALGYMSEQ